MFRFLAQPYPSTERNSRRWLFTSAGAGLFVALFLIVFQPFGSAEWHHPQKLPILAGFGMVTFAGMILVGFVVPAVFKNFFLEKHWNVGREIAWNIIIIIVIAFGNLLYSEWAFGEGFNRILPWLGITAAIGSIPATMITLLNYNRLLRQYTHESLPANYPQTPVRPAAPITFRADNEKDSLSVTLDELLFIESADNYSEIVYWRADKLQKTLLRGSLTRMEEQSSHSPDLVRCHRSYIVNLQQVETITGNAQGYKLHLRKYDSPLPVARRFGDRVAGYFRK
jgi:hypothetical protein